MRHRFDGEDSIKAIITDRYLHVVTVDESAQRLHISGVKFGAFNLVRIDGQSNEISCGIASHRSHGTAHSAS